MKRTRILPGLCALLAAGSFTGCETTDSATVSTTSYYSTGFSDPWYHGDVYRDGGVVTPPGDRGPRPTHPIALPPASSAPRPTPMPSIPSGAGLSGGGGRR
jgi:hypothetical protein